MNVNCERTKKLVEHALSHHITKLNPTLPFLWASGYYMPIYNDNRLYLKDPDVRAFIANGFMEMSEEHSIHYDIVAGTSTAGIPPATTFADMVRKPLIYVRDKPKDHGMRNRIEGIDSDESLIGKSVVLIEDLVSTGGSSVSAVQAIRQAGGKINYCLSIFTYGFSEAIQMFEGKRTYDKEGTKLQQPCKHYPLVTYDDLLDIALSSQYITLEERKLLDSWREDPFNWGEKHGFPPVKKT